MFDGEFGKMVKICLVVILVVFIGRMFVTGGTKSYRGNAFTFMPPEGWDLVKETEELVVFSTPERHPKKDMALASMSIMAKPLGQAVWIEDEFPSILESLSREFVIHKKGEIMVDEVLSKWVLYEDTRNDMINIDFFLVTEGNTFMKIQLSTMFDEFKKYRSIFEASKETMKIKKGLM